jgi:hypothetical protein
MGQITTAELGVSVSLPLTYANIKLILHLLEMRMDIRVLRTYVSGINENEDEIKDYENDDFEVDMIDEFDEDINEDEFNEICNKLDLEINRITFHFIYNCAAIYADNISFRQTSHLFYSNECSPNDLIENIQKGAETFRSAQVPEHFILIGHSIFDG